MLTTQLLKTDHESSWSPAAGALLALRQNEWLSGKPGVRRVTIDRRGGVVEELGSVRAPQQGRDLQLALDSRVQHLAFRELKRGVDAHRAKGGAAVVLDARSGEILALVNYPTAKPGDRAAAATGGLRNRAVAEWKEFRGKRGGAGKVAPKGFSRSGRFSDVIG